MSSSPPAAATTGSAPPTGGDDAAAPGGRRSALAIASLALGGFAYGTTEFVTMGLLPDISAGVGIDIPTGGHLISAYALGVVVGAPTIAALGARLPRRGLLVGLMTAFLLGNVLTAVAPGYLSVLTARFVAGVPHGAYFGVASLVAASLVAPERRGRAVSSVMLGIAAANLAGVPAGTWLGQTVGWRSAYWAVVVLSVLTVVAVLLLVPRTPGNPHATVRQELGALRRPQVVLTLLVGMIGFGGMFAMYSYIAPLVTDVARQPSSSVPLYLLSFGVAGVLGTALGGRLADIAVFRSLVGALVAVAVLLGVLALVATRPVALFVAVFGVSVATSVLVVNLQLRLMEVAGDAQMFGAALNHASLNMANALGAWLGGLVIAAGYGYTAPSVVGVGLAVVGLAVLAVSGLLRSRELAGSPAG